MRTAVATAIMLLVALLAALVAYLLARRAVVAWHAALLTRRRTALEARLSSWLDGHTETPAIDPNRLRRWPDRRLAMELCLQRLPDANPEVRAELVRWLEGTGYVKRWIRDLHHRDPWRREQAAEHLGKLHLPGAIEPLIEALADPALDVRMRAARALGAFGGARARAALVAAMTDENRWSAIRIADLLADMGPDVLDEVVAVFPTLGRSAKLAAIDIIARVGGARQGELLCSLLAGDDIDIRARAAAALGRIRFAPATPALIARLDDPAWPVRAMAAKALGALGATEAIAALCRGLRDREWWVRVDSAVALREIGPPGIEALLDMMSDADPFARDQARTILSEETRR